MLAIALTQAIFQAWCYNTGSHPSDNPHLLWGILPQTDSHLYYTQACQLLHGEQISAAHGARHAFPVFLAALLRVSGHDFVWVTSLFTLLMALATWSVFEVVRLRLGGLAAAIHLALITYYIRSYCTGLFMAEQLGVLFSLCAVAVLVESLSRQGRARTWLWCGGLFFLTQALNARPAAYMTLPLLVVTAWPLFRGDRKAKARMLGLGTVFVGASLLLHYVNYDRAVASPKQASNGWLCVYGLLNDGNWKDGRDRFAELRDDGPVALTDAQASYALRAECLSEIRHHPGKLLRGWWRALEFGWKENSLYRSSYPRMPALWLTEAARWCTVLGLLLSVTLLFSRRVSATIPTEYRRVGWLLVAATAGMIASFPLAPPWDGGARVFGATLALFFLAPEVGVSLPILFVIRRLRRLSVTSKPGRPEPAGSRAGLLSAGALAGTLSLVVALGPWWLVDGDRIGKGRRHPALGLWKQLRHENSASTFKLASLHSGYRIHLSDDSLPTRLPRISATDFIRGLPQGSYRPVSEQLRTLPAGTEIMTLPYFMLLVLDETDARTGKFTPKPEQIGHHVWPPVYFSKGAESTLR